MKLHFLMQSSYRKKKMMYRAAVVLLNPALRDFEKKFLTPALYLFSTFVASHSCTVGNNEEQIVFGIVVFFRVTIQQLFERNAVSFRRAIILAVSCTFLFLHAAGRRYYLFNS